MDALGQFLERPAVAGHQAHTDFEILCRCLLAKLERRVPIYLYHFKPPYVDELRQELAATDLPHPVTELEQDRTYQL